MVPEARHISDNGAIGAVPVPEGPPAPQAHTGRDRWRWRVAAVLAAVLLMAGLGGAALALAQQGTPPARPADRQQGNSPPASNEAEVRSQAVTWILHQVSRATFVACDPVVCNDLARGGFPNLLTISPQSNDPLVAQLVVSTAAVRAQLRDRLASVWAPAIIAAFGSGNDRIEIRLEFPGGATGYRDVAGKYLHARKTLDALLLTNGGITFSAKARAQLRSGEIDPRLPELLSIMVHRHPVQVAGFVDQSPGGGPASLLRSMDLATADPPAHLTSSSYIDWMQSFIKAQRTKYRAALSLVNLPTGQVVMRIWFRAPSPLNPRST
jgi:hypothetical protein